MRVQETSPFPKRLKLARKRKKLSQAKLGELAGIDPSVAAVKISRYENGIHTPPFNLMAKLAYRLDVPVPFFFCKDDWVANMMLLIGRPTRLTKAQRDEILALTREIVNEKQ